MKLLRAQGHFGVLSGQEIRFEDGMNVFYLPNEGGKSTLCNFVRVMLYGLNNRRDGKNQLSDKTKYRPVDGEPMSGILELEWKGKRIVISRQTGHGNAPMQEFSAYDAMTGQPCPELTAKDCGKVLTGVSEEGFLSSAMLNGQAQELNAKELEERMLSLSTTGDGAMAYSTAVSQLDRWKNALRGAGNRGRYAQVEAECEQIGQSIQRLDNLTAEIHGYEEQLPEAQQYAEQEEKSYQQVMEDFTLLFVAKREQAERQEREARENLAKLKKELPDLEKLKAAERAEQELKQAQTAYENAKNELDEVTLHYQRWRDDIDRSEDEYSMRSDEDDDIRIRGWSMVLAVLCGVFAVISLLGLIPAGAVTEFLPYIFSILAIVFLVITFIGSTKTLDVPPMDFDEERVKLEKRRQNAAVSEPLSEERLAIARERFQDAARAFLPDHAEEDELGAFALIDAAAAQRDYYEEQEQDYAQLRQEYLHILELTGPNGTERQKLNAQKAKLDAAREQVNRLQQSIAAAKGKAEEIGTRESLTSRLDRLAEEKENILWQLDAIRLAKESLIRANAELTGRVSPMINQLAQNYMQTLTDNKYTAMQLYTNLEASCRRSNSAVEMDKLRLSTGTRDQLYLALRLAVCKVLLDGEESVPIMLDDPFVNYDDRRTACGMQLLREIARERQVILLTCRKP